MAAKVSQDGHVLVSIADGGTGATADNQADILTALNNILAELQTANLHLAAIEANTAPA